MAHAKSVSWHHHVTNDLVDVSPSRARTTSMSETPNKGYSYHRAGRTPLSHSKNRFRTRNLISPTPIGTSPNYKFQFPPSHSRGNSLSSPTWEVEDSLLTVATNSPDEESPYILNSQPSLQDIFITLANKERRVLEAKEQLMNAETELALFRHRWSAILNVQVGSVRKLILVPKNFALGLNTITYRRLGVDEYLKLKVVDNEFDADMAVPIFEEHEDAWLFEKIMHYYKEVAEDFFATGSTQQAHPILVKPCYPSVIQVCYQTVEKIG